MRTLQSEHGLARVLAELLAGRMTPEHGSVEQFLDPRLRDICDPFELNMLPEAVERLIAALGAGEDILIVGDYDVDGMTSTAQLVDALRYFGGNPRYQLPRRMEEGYGLSAAMVERILEGQPPQLLVALDCGTNSVEEVARLRQLGVEVLIVDHHEAKHAVPADCLLINPKLYPGCPCEELCTAGLVFKLVHGLVKRLRQLNDRRAHALKLKPWLDLVALGTVADLVPLRGENRVYAHEGLSQLANTTRPGLKALLEIAGLGKGHALCGADVAYKLGPRLNAGGRLADATMPLELLLTDKFAEGFKMATELDTLNRERQAIERQMYDEAQASVHGTVPEAIVVAGDEWHAGVVGIVAGRLARHYYRPSIVLCRDGELYRGSGRSIAEVDLQEVLHDCNDLLEEWGGHRMAVGLAVSEAKLHAFQEAFSARVGTCFGETLPEPSQTIDAWMQADELGPDLLAQLDQLRPFGMENPEPVLGLKRAVLPRAPTVFAQRHLKFELNGQHGRRISGIAWGAADNPPPAGRELDLAIRFTWNIWQGKRSPRIELVGWR